MHIVINGAVHEVYMHTELRVDLFDQIIPDPNWFLIRFTQIDPIADHAVPGRFDPNEESVVYCADNRWLTYDALDTQTKGIGWVRGKFHEYRVNLDSNKEAKGLLK